MIDALHKWLAPPAICVAGHSPAIHRLPVVHARLRCVGTRPGVTKSAILDVRFAYTPEDARLLFEALGAGGRNLYVVYSRSPWTSSFPSFTEGCSRSWSPTCSAVGGRYLVLFPVLGLVFDLLENITIALLAWTFAGVPHQPPGMGGVGLQLD